MKFSFEIRRQILNFSDEVTTRSESLCLLYNHRKSTLILSQLFGICCHFSKLTYFYSKVCITKKHRLYQKTLTLQLTYQHCVKSVRIRSKFQSVFFRIRTEYGEILRISPYSVRLRENTDQNNFEYGHFLRSVTFQNWHLDGVHSISDLKLPWCNIKYVLLKELLLKKYSYKS